MSASPAAHPQGSVYLRVLHNRPLLWMWTGQSISLVGDAFLAISAQPLEKVKVRSGDAGALPVPAYPGADTPASDPVLRAAR